MRRRSLTSLIVVLAIGLSPSRVDAQASTSARRDSIVTFVRSYVDAANRADVHASMEMMSRSPSVSSVALGSITRGWESVRAQADSAAGSEGQFKVSLGSMDVTLLGTSAALVVTAASIWVETEDGPVQLRGALTLVVERVAGVWKVLHEHLSVPLPEG